MFLRWHSPFNGYVGPTKHPSEHILLQARTLVTALRPQRFSGRQLEQFCVIERKNHLRKRQVIHSCGNSATFHRLHWRHWLSLLHLPMPHPAPGKLRRTLLRLRRTADVVNAMAVRGAHRTQCRIPSVLDAVIGTPWYEFRNHRPPGSKLVNSVNHHLILFLGPWRKRVCRTQVICPAVSALTSATTRKTFRDVKPVCALACRHELGYISVLFIGEHPPARGADFVQMTETHFNDIVADFNVPSRRGLLH